MSYQKPTKKEKQEKQIKINNYLDYLKANKEFAENFNKESEGKK